jgi:hypothetical protein
MDEFSEIAGPPCSGTMLTAAQIQSGPPIGPIARIVTYSASDWESFIEEWVSSLKKKYQKVLRFTGAGDKGIDLAGFKDAKLLKGVWDNYQCKHYAKPLAASDVLPEIGKILWYSFQEDYVPPRGCYFVAPKQTSTTLTHLLANADKLKGRVISSWDTTIRDKIITSPIPLTGSFATYVKGFDFSIFQSLPLRDVLEDHRTTPYFLARFGGGLPPRPLSKRPPEEVDAHEMRYVGHLLEAYADHQQEQRVSVADLTKWSVLKDHFRRSREAFYHAESLRVFVRDKVEPGTFEGLQQEVYDGVIDTCNAVHGDGYERVVAVTAMAQSLSLDAHPLSSSTFPSDRRGICHQLANEDRLIWTKK